MSTVLNVLKKYIKPGNKYLWVIVAFILWMAFFDSHRISIQWALSRKVHTLENQVQDYQQKIVQAKKDAIDLEVNKEKYAREKYYMHTPGEDVFIMK